MIKLTTTTSSTTSTSTEAIPDKDYHHHHQLDVDNGVKTYYPGKENKTLQELKTSATSFVVGNENESGHLVAAGNKDTGIICTNSLIIICTFNTRASAWLLIIFYLDKIRKFPFSLKSLSFLIFGNIWQSP